MLMVSSIIEQVLDQLTEALCSHSNNHYRSVSTRELVCLRQVFQDNCGTNDSTLCKSLPLPAGPDIYLSDPAEMIKIGLNLRSMQP